MENQCQHLTVTQRNELLKLLQKFEDFFDGYCGRCEHPTVTQRNELLKYYRNLKIFSMEHLAHGKISSRLRVKRGCKANLLGTTPSTESTLGNVQKGG